MRLQNAWKVSGQPGSFKAKMQLCHTFSFKTSSKQLIIHQFSRVHRPFSSLFYHTPLQYLAIFKVFLVLRSLPQPFSFRFFITHSFSFCITLRFLSLYHPHTRTASLHQHHHQLPRLFLVKHFIYAGSSAHSFRMASFSTFHTGISQPCNTVGIAILSGASLNCFPFSYLLFICLFTAPAASPSCVTPLSTMQKEKRKRKIKKGERKREDEEEWMTKMMMKKKIKKMNKYRIWKKRLWKWMWWIRKYENTD